MLYSWPPARNLDLLAKLFIAIFLTVLDSRLPLPAAKSGHRLELAAELLVQQEQVQRDDDRRDHVGQGVGPPVVDQISHHRFAARQQDQGDQSKGERETKYNLR